MTYITCVIAAVGATAAFAGVDASDFARDFLSGRASVLVIGDSTNNPRGSSAFVPYYEGVLRRLPSDVPVCGFRISESTGNTSVGQYMRFGGGSTDQFIENRVVTRTPDDAVLGSPGMTIPGYRNEFTIIPGGSLPEFGRFASHAMTDVARICPAATDDWAGATLTVRACFVTDPGGVYLGSFAAQPLSDHDGSAGDSIWGYEGGQIADVELDDIRWGLQPVDFVFHKAETERLGIRFAGDVDADDAEEGGASVSWGPLYYYASDMAAERRGLFYDSISIGGYSAADHAGTLGTEMLSEYMSASPVVPDWIVVWIGQNMDGDEWNGSLLPVFGERIEHVADTAVGAALLAGGTAPNVLLVTPPAASGVYPNARFEAVSDTLRALAVARGWAHLDLHGVLGSTLTAIDGGYCLDGVHPTLAGSEYVAERLLADLMCRRAEWTGDDTKNIFDVQAFVDAYLVRDARADFNGDAVFNVFDMMLFMDAFGMDCP